MALRLLDWVDERTGWRTGLRRVLEHPVPGGASVFYVFGSTLALLLVLQTATGVLLALYYSPSATDAWASVAYVQDQVTLGWFIRGLHHHGASAIVVLAGLHLLQTALFGAYRRPREVNWLVGVVLLGVLLAFSLTGYLLPWDQNGYWATRVATSLVGSVPLVGGWLQRVLQGGNEYGNLTLTRFHALHVLVLPVILVTLVAAHLALFRRHGVTPRWGLGERELAARAEPFWPGQAFRDVVAVAVAVGAVAGITVATHGAPLDAPADPSSGYDARPEWYFLPLYQALKLARGPLEPVVALGLPLLTFLLLAAVPFLDRTADRSPTRRLRLLGVVNGGFVCLATLGAAALWADGRDATLRERGAQAETDATRTRTLALQGVPVAGGTAVWDNDPSIRAERLFAAECASCHVGAARKGPEIGPGYNSRAWIRGLLHDPDAPEYFGATKGLHLMKPARLEEAELAAVVEMVYAETGAGDADAALASRGRELFEDGPCSDCHSLDPAMVDDPGPNLTGRGSREWFAALLADPGHERFFGAKNEMPSFAGKLPPAEIERLAEWLVSLRDRTR